MTLPAVTFGANGLIPGIVQDAATGRVLMLGYLNAESLDLTIETGFVHFWSRSRGAIWRKGSTTGNTLRVIGLAADCDADALLIRAEAAGPTCHSGAVSCFGDDPVPGFGALDVLWTTIRQRAAARPPGSYTVRLLDGGVDECGRKVLEEAGEVLVAAKNHAAGSGPGQHVNEEAADLVYHLLVLLAERGLDAGDLVDIVRARATAPATGRPRRDRPTAEPYAAPG